ncbi:MAG: efflux RND transporter periplasmic adaptor subunit [Lentisphaerae bacterium]|nr:efflux RND transporter periplasmic adaptor subunit [Lentisphaerota bacterium]MCP4102864.1 efflux RND transporter periplasmic adaptor subunit [Lentisphaerota bacterium]
MNFSRITVLLLVGTLFLAGCKPKRPVIKPSSAVVVVPVKLGNIVASTIIIGQVKAYDKVELVARVKGFLQKRNFIEGELVKKGQLLFLIEQDQYKADVIKAKAAVMSAMADKKNADIDYERQRALYQKRAVAQKEFDNAAANKMSADASVLKAQAELKNAELDLSYTQIKAPFDGIVGLAAYSVGNVVGPDSDSLDSIVKVDPVRVQFNLSEVDVLRIQKEIIKEGKDRKKEVPIIVKLIFQDGSEYGRTGKITFWNNQVNSSTGTFLMQATFENPNVLLLPGMYVRVQLEGRKSYKALLIPQVAVSSEQTGDYVMVVNKDKKAVRRKVELGRKKGLNVEVKSGLKEGELVVTEGLQKIREGMIVKPVLGKSYPLGNTIVKPLNGTQMPLPSDVNNKLNKKAAPAERNAKASGNVEQAKQPVAAADKKGEAK